MSEAAKFLLSGAAVVLLFMVMKNQNGGSSFSSSNNSTSYGSISSQLNFAGDQTIFGDVTGGSTLGGIGGSGVFGL